MPEKKNVIESGSEITFDDLKYSREGEKYSFEFTYIKKGIFLITSKGYADEHAIKSQMQTGEIARERLLKKYPGTPFHLIWDISELRGASILARYAMMRHAATGKFASISAIGANNLAKSYIRIVSSLTPHLKFSFYNNVNTAINEILTKADKLSETDPATCLITSETNAYASFIDLWQEKTDFIKIGQEKLKIVSLDSWKFSSPESNFQVEYSVIESYIILIRCEGFIKTPHIEKIYSILEEIMSHFGYVDATNKFYTILDLKKVKGISLNARRQTKYYEELYKERAHLVIMLPSPILHFALKIQKKINFGSFKHWTEGNSTEEAIRLIHEHKNGRYTQDQVDKNEDKLHIPESKDELKKLLIKYHFENQQLKNNQKEHIQRILEITGRMTWDESFTNKMEFLPGDYGPFTDVYNALTIVHDDFKEIIREKLIHAQELRESEDKYWNLINLASDIIAVFQDGKCKLVNSRVADVMGYSPDEAKQILPKDFLPSVEYAKIIPAVEKLKDNGTSYFDTEIIHKNGSLVPVSVSVGAITFEKKPARIYIVRDITAKRIAEAELLNYRNRLEAMVAERTRQLEKEITERESAEKSDRLKSAFLSNMSHEIRTPMNAIIAFSNFLRNPEISHSQREEYVNYIQSSGESLLNLINDIIDISKIEAKQINIHKINCAINPLLEELYTLFEDTRKNKGCIGLQISILKKFDDKNLIINTDPYRLKQILSNLLHNALKFTEVGTIEFGYEVVGKRIIFFVKDTGIGIPADKVEFIFERFGKLETSGKNKGGTGLGLAISQNLAKLLGGKLTVESVLGKGSTFYLYLPFIEEHQETEKNTFITYIEKESYNWEEKKVIIAEDEELNFKVLQIALQKTGIEIIRASNGHEAIEAVFMNPDVHIILMDIQMPLMDGYEALTRIKQINYHIPVIAQTAFAMIEEKESCLRIGFNDYISKPIKIEELLRKIDKLIL